MSSIQRKDMRCGKCNFCVKDNGYPYCVMKDLYTNVEPDNLCDETNIYGEYWFAREKVKKEQQQ